MKSTFTMIIYGLIGLCIGLGVGYATFGHIDGTYLDLNEIFATSKGFFDSLARTTFGVEDMRTRILGCGAGGAVFGVIIASIASGSKKD